MLNSEPSLIAQGDTQLAVEVHNIYISARGKETMETKESEVVGVLRFILL